MRFTAPFVVATLFLSLVRAKSYGPPQFPQYQSGPPPHHDQGNPTSRHKNHCAYVVEKTVTFTVQDGAAPYVKAEYNKCSWGHKCPTLMYRLMYKPTYKVAHKSVTELEWRCCPGFSGYGCMEGHPVYQHPPRMMPPFKGPPMKGPQFKGPVFKGPMFKGPTFKGPMFKGPPAVKANPWLRSKAPPPSGGFDPYPPHHYGPPTPSHYPDASFESYPPEPEPMPEEHHTESGHEHEHGQRVEELLPQGIPPPPPPAEEQPEEEVMGQSLDGETSERLYQVEEDVRRLSQGLETLRGTVSGLEDSLRASLREDANRMLSALLNAAPGPVAAPALASNPSTVGFVEIPGGDPEKEGLDGRRVLPGLTELNARVEELRTQLQAETAELQQLRATVNRHRGALEEISGRAQVASDATGEPGGDVAALIDAKLGGARTDIAGGVEKRVEGAERRCEERAAEERRRCQRERGERQQQMEGALEESSAHLRAELRGLRAQVDGVKAAESCCGRLDGLADRVALLEASVTGLNQSQGHLRGALGGHRDHVEGILEGRLAYVEAQLNGTGRGRECGRGVTDRPAAGQALEDRMDGKLKAVEGRLLAALEELGNATAPALLEGHAVPTLETELEALRGRLEVDVDRVQKHLSSLEVLCSSSCAAAATTQKSAVQGDAAAPGGDWDAREALETQRHRLDRLNDTVQSVAKRLSLREQAERATRDPPIQGELTVIKFNVRSVNHTLRGLRDSLGTVAQQVGRANSSWHEREARLAQQIKGVVQLVGHQASMLGAGERRLARLKAELQELRRRLAEEVRGCRSTALVVKQEVSEVGGRVASVEDQCKGLNFLAEDLERIREELERQSSGLLLQVNGTLSSHAQQLSQLQGELRNCSRAEPSPTGPGAEPQDGRGDTFALN